MIDNQLYPILFQILSKTQDSFNKKFRNCSHSLSNKSFSEKLSCWKSLDEVGNRTVEEFKTSKSVLDNLIARKNNWVSNCTDEVIATMKEDVMSLENDIESNTSQ